MNPRNTDRDSRIRHGFAIIGRWVALIVCAVTLNGCQAWFDLIEPFSNGPSPGALSNERNPEEYRPVMRYPPAYERPRSSVFRSSSADPWELLSEGCHREAVRAFDREVRRCPGAGLPVIGYSLALAGTGNLERGARAMRIAIAIDPHALRYVPVDRRMSRWLDRLITCYHECAGRHLESDPLFMLAALYFIQEDLDSAHSAITVCCRIAGRSRAVRSLHSMIERALARIQPCDQLTSPVIIQVEPMPRETARRMPPRQPLPQSSSHGHTRPPEPVDEPEPDARPRGQWPPPGLIGPADDLPSDALPPMSAPVGANSNAAVDPYAANATESPQPTTTPTEPIEPVDYDRLRAEIVNASDQLDRFTEKLLESIANRGR